MQPIQSNPKKQKENESPNFQQWTTENCKKKPKANNVLFIWTKQNNITRKNALKKPDWIELHSFFADYFFGSVQKINSHYLLGLFCCCWSVLLLSMVYRCVVVAMAINFSIYILFRLHWCSFYSSSCASCNGHIDRNW